MSPADSAVLEEGSRRPRPSIWVAPVAGLVGLWLWLAFSSGGYITRQWLPPSLVLGLLGLVVSLLVAYPRRPRQLSLALLALFACYGVWVAFSALWADSSNRVWIESGRTFAYLLVFALALTFFADAGARQWFRYLLMLAAFALLVGCVASLWSQRDIAGLFFEGRLSYPVSYPNGAGALFLVSFWPLMWLASGTEERAPVRGAALGLVTGILGLAVMTQSRGAIYSLAVAMVFMFLISPARLRLLFYLLVPAVLMVYEFPKLNRYWLEGPAAVGGSVAARTLLVASVTAAFIGVILALLERWIKVTSKMKTLFGGVVLLGFLGAGIYGAITLTSDVGGPLAWISRSWHQFTTSQGAQDANNTTSAGATRFTVVSSSGRVGIWKIAWQEFENEPLKGVGADNFVFQFDRLRTTETYKPLQAHSFELQVLGETGVVGGVLVFGGILMALVGILLPRVKAGWRRARASWLRKPKSRAAPADGTVSTPQPALIRWGSEPRAYGWEMALLAGSVYWLVHASVDWLWQMAGVTIPALLFVAAAVAAVDARAVVLWPRLSRRLHAGTPAAATASAAGPADRESRWARWLARGRNSLGWLQPPGLLSFFFRSFLVTLSIVVLVIAGLSYLSLRLQDSALALASRDGARAVSRAESTRLLEPSDPSPFVIQAAIYSGAAADALAGHNPDRAGAVIDDLALALSSYQRAAQVEPADWSLRYGAGVAALNLLLAEGYLDGTNPALDYEALVPVVSGLNDWSALSGLPVPPDPGEAQGSLAVEGAPLEAARAYRALSREGLAQLALESLNAAKERNPLASQTGEAIGLVQQIQGD